MDIRLAKISPNFLLLFIINLVFLLSRLWLCRGQGCGWYLDLQGPGQQGFRVTKRTLDCQGTAHRRQTSSHLNSFPLFYFSFFSLLFNILGTEPGLLYSKHPFLGGNQTSFVLSIGSFCHEATTQSLTLLPFYESPSVSAGTDWKLQEARFYCLCGKQVLAGRKKMQILTSTKYEHSAINVTVCRTILKDATLFCIWNQIILCEKQSMRLF